MSIALDGIIFSLQRHGGISVYFRELIAELAAVQMQATLTLDTPVIQKAPHALETMPVSELGARTFERFRRARLPAPAKVFHSSYYRLPERSSVPSVVTVHDFTYERFFKGPALWMHRHQKHKAIRAAQAIICISEATKDDLYELVGVRTEQTVHVVHNGVGQTYRPLDNTTHHPNELLFVGDRRGYKNFRLLLEALAFLPEYQVKCVGGGDLQKEEFQGLVGSESIRERVTHLGFLTDEQLNATYNRVACLVYPSAYEGFGIPVIEAMRAGCPVVCTDCKAIKEVGGSALGIASDMTPEALADAIVKLNDPVARKAAVDKGLNRANEFSWHKTHSQTIQIYQQLIA